MGVMVSQHGAVGQQLTLLSPNLKPLSNGFYNIYIFYFIYRMPCVYIQMKKKKSLDIKSHPVPTFARSLEMYASLLPRICVCAPNRTRAWGLGRGSGGADGASVPIVCGAVGASSFLGHIFSCCKQ